MSEFILIEFRDLLNPEFYIQNGGLWLFLFIVFAETGLFAGFFLPGDSLLFVAGIYSSELAAEVYNTENGFLNLLLITILVVIVGVLGNMAGYWFGSKSGPYLFKRQDTFFFRKKHLYTAKAFYDKNGGGAIVFRAAVRSDRAASYDPDRLRRLCRRQSCLRAGTQYRGAGGGPLLSGAGLLCRHGHLPRHCA
jgi:hypothetical protein